MIIRKRMYAVLSIVLILIVLLSSAVGFASAETTVIKGEPDGQSKSTAMDEHFYTGTLEPNFTSDNVSVVTDSYAMHFAGAYQYGSAVVLTAYKLKNYNRFTFTIDSISSNDGFLYCGIGGSSASDECWRYDMNVTLASRVTAIYEMGGGDQWVPVGDGYQLPNVYEPGKSTEFAVTVELVSGKNYKITTEVLDGEDVIASTDYNTTIRLDHGNGGYFCMWSGMNECYNMRNFKVYDSPTHVAFSDDFKDSSLTYSSEAIGDSKWHINNSMLDSEDIYLCRNAGPEFKKANAAITAKSKLETCDKVTKPYEITSTVRINSLTKNTTFGFFFGAQKAGAIDKATVIGVSTYDKDFAAVNLFRNGKLTNAGENQIPLSTLDIGGSTIKIKAIIYGDNSVIFEVNGVQVKLYNVEYDGYWGACVYSSDNVSTADVKMDDISVVKNTYAECTATDRYNNFAGIKLTPDGFEEYYISDRSYYIGPGVALRPKGAFTTDPSLYFQETGSYSSFGPKETYTDFILEFDVKVVSPGANGQWFGVSFGKSNYATPAASVPGVSFAYNGWTDTPYSTISTTFCELDDGTRERKIEGYHFYKDPNIKYNFMLVARNRTVYIYFKEDGEDISKLGICRGVIPNVNTAGYVMVYGSGGLAFDIFNYKLTNISAEATGDSPIALREAFEGTAISDKLTTEGAAEVKDGALKLSGGSLAMKNKGRYYMVNCAVSDLKDDFSLSFAGSNAVTLSKDMKTITVKEGGKNTKFDVSEYNLSDYKKLQLQLIMQYDSLTVAAKGVYEPYDKLSSPIVEYTFAKPLDEGTLKWTSKDAVIDDIAVYSLDRSYTAGVVNYEDDPNIIDMWTPKETVVGRRVAEETKVKEAAAEKELPLAYIIAYAVIGAVIVALLVVIVILFVKKRGKKA